MVFDHRPLYPMIFTFELAFKGELCQRTLREALQLVTSRYPLLWARLERHRWRWILPSQPFIPLHLRKGELSDLNLETVGGTELLLCEGKNGSLLRLYGHHACTDAHGALEFLRDLLLGYHQLKSGEEVRFHPQEPRVLRERGNLRPPVQSTNNLPVWATLKIVWDWLFKGPALMRNPPGESRPDPPREVSTYHFGSGAAGQLLAKAGEKELRMNTISFALLFQWLSRWQRELGRPHLEERMRLLMPTNLRTRDEASGGACNRIGYAFLTRTLKDSLDFGALCRSIQQEVQFIQSYRPDFMMLDLMSFVDRLGCLRPGLALPLRYATAVQTYFNLTPLFNCFERRGDDYKIGDALLESCAAAAPVRPGVGATFGVFRLGHKFSIALRTDATRFSLESEERMLAQLVDCWHRFGDLEAG